MTTALVPTETLSGPGPIALESDAAHHLRDVLRIRPGEAVRLVDGFGHARGCTVESVDKRAVRLAFSGETETLPPPPAEITLFQCVAKPARMDWLLEKIVEVGVARIVPILSERVVAHVKKGETPDRWGRILEAGLCQCGGAHATALAPAVDWAGALDAMRALDAPVFVGSLAPGAIPLLAALRDRIPQSAARPVRLGWLVGPEGDFSPDELASALALPNAVPVTLGARVLRVETATLYGCSAMLAHAEAL